MRAHITTHPFFLKPLPPILLAKGDTPSKEELVGHIVRKVDEGVMKWCAEVDLKELCVNSHRQLMEMKVGGGGWGDG